MSNSKEIGIIGQVKAATSNPIALLVGCLLGGFIPLATYFVAHESQQFTFWSLTTALVLGGLLYSAKTVWQWGKLAFACPYKASGFVLLVEGVMVTSHISWLSVAALCYLIAINAAATGCLLAQKDIAVNMRTRKLGTSEHNRASKKNASGKSSKSRAKTSNNGDASGARSLRSVG